MPVRISPPRPLAWGALLLCLLSLLTTRVDPARAATTEVFVIPVRGEVEPPLAAFIKRATREAAQTPGSLIVLELDTFGGRVDAGLAIVDTMVALERHRTIAFVDSKAISAGALIALSCNDLVMRPSTTIGDCAPITFTNEGPSMLGEKFQSPLRAKFRSLARRNNYPPALAAAMVSSEMEVYAVHSEGRTRYLDSKEYNDLPAAEKERLESRKTVVTKGELLTMDDTEAKALDFSRMTAASVPAMLAGFGITDYRIVRLDQSWSETMSRLIARLSPLLLMIGLAALYLEIKAPGFGLPGIVGILCLGLVFLNQYLVGLADYTELLLVLLGVVLLAMEIFVIPGFGVAGVAGFLCLAIGLILSLQDFVLPNPDLPWQGKILEANVIQVLGSLLSAFCLALLFLRFVFPRLGRVMEGPYLETTLASSHADSIEAGRVTIGATGLARTPLRPAGKVALGNEVIDAISEGEYLDQETPVVVTEVHGNRVIVRRRAA